MVWATVPPPTPLPQKSLLKCVIFSFLSNISYSFKLNVKLTLQSS